MPPADPPGEKEAGLHGSLPPELIPGTTILIASAELPTDHAIDLQILCEYGSPADTGIVVTTTESAQHTIDTYDDLCPDRDRPSLGIVDSVSVQQSVTALYGETPVVFTPAPGNLERLVMALSELASTHQPMTETRHFVIRSLSPMLDTASVEQVGTVLDRITGLRTGEGFCLLGVEYTAHEETTLETLTEHVDGILWVERSPSDQLTFEYQRTTRHDIRP